MVRAHFNLPDLADEVILGVQENHRKRPKQLVKSV
jgi:hypothetical protein